MPDVSSNSLNIDNLQLVLFIDQLDCTGISINEHLYYGSGISLENRQCFIRDTNTGTNIKYWINVESDNDPVFAKKCIIKGSSAASMYISGDLTVEGKIYGQLENYESSDERKKTFENSINVDFDKLALLRKSYFTYNEKPSVQKIGVSAQEIQKLYPEIVGTDPRGYLGVDYSKLSVIALKAIDQLHERVKYLEGVIESLSK